MPRALLFDLDGTLMDHDAARDAGFAAHSGLRGIWLDRNGDGAAADGVVRIAGLDELPAALA